MEDMSIKEDAQRIQYERTLHNPDTRYDRDWMTMEIDALEAKGDALQKEVIASLRSLLTLRIRSITLQKTMQKLLRS